MRFEKTNPLILTLIATFILALAGCNSISPLASKMSQSVEVGEINNQMSQSIGQVAISHWLAPPTTHSITPEARGLSEVFLGSRGVKEIAISSEIKKAIAEQVEGEEYGALVDADTLVVQRGTSFWYYPVSMISHPGFELIPLRNGDTISSMPHQLLKVWQLDGPKAAKLGDRGEFVLGGENADDKGRFRFERKLNTQFRKLFEGDMKVLDPNTSEPTKSPILNIAAAERNDTVLVYRQFKGAVHIAVLPTTQMSRSIYDSAFDGMLKWRLEDKDLVEVIAFETLLERLQ